MELVEIKQFVQTVVILIQPISYAIAALRSAQLALPSVFAIIVQQVTILMDQHAYQYVLMAPLVIMPQSSV